jgi:hypothetical protein
MISKYEHNTVTLINALAIRDTNNHVSDGVDIRGFNRKGFYIDNGLNQDMTVQIQGCHTNSATTGDWANIGSAQTATKSTKTIIGAKEVTELANVFNYLRVIAACASGPASGTATVILMVG